MIKAYLVSFLPSQLILPVQLLSLPELLYTAVDVLRSPPVQGKLGQTILGLGACQARHTTHVQC